MDKQKIGLLIDRVRETNPLIHNITNIVVANFTANGLLALGASPVMASAREEVAEIAKVADALVLNLGTLSQDALEAMVIAGKSANLHNVPVVLDPVGAGATSYRTLAAQKIVREVNIGLIRGNAAEIANLIGENGEIKGVDAAEAGNGNPVELSFFAAKKLNSIVIVTGKDDVISDGTSTFLVNNGHPLLKKVTGAGCLLSAVVGAFAAVGNNGLEAAVAALTFYGVAAEIAAGKTAELGPGSFQIELLNQLFLVTGDEIAKYSSYVGISESFKSNNE